MSEKTFNPNEPEEYSAWLKTLGSDCWADEYKQALENATKADHNKDHDADWKWAACNIERRARATANRIKDVKAALDLADSPGPVTRVVLTITTFNDSSRPSLSIPLFPLPGKRNDQRDHREMQVFSAIEVQLGILLAYYESEIEHL